MIVRELASFILNEAKNTGDAIVSTSIFNEVQEKICQLQPINGILNMFLIKVNLKNVFENYWAKCSKKKGKLYFKK